MRVKGFRWWIKRENCLCSYWSVSGKGRRKTKISDIVKLAGIAQGTFYLYFPSKLSVMPAIAEVMVEKMILAVKEKVQKDVPFQIKWHK